MRHFLLVLSLVGCQSTPDSAHGDAAALDTQASAFVLTSPALTEGGAIMPENACAGANTSPQLAWAGAPSGTQSYAVVLTDQSINLVHWVIYDMPGDLVGLPVNVEKTYTPVSVTGAHQTTSYQAATRGYLGPCPPNIHTYQFVVYAVDVATLPGVMVQTTRDQAIATINAHKVGYASLTGTYTP